MREETDRLVLPCVNTVSSTPTPLLTWTKDGVEIYTIEEGNTATISMGFLMAFPEFILGVVIPTLLQVDEATGTLIFNTAVENVTGIATDRIVILDAVIGTYTCNISNVYGGDTIQFTIRDCGKYIDMDRGMGREGREGIP